MLFINLCTCDLFITSLNFSRVYWNGVTFTHSFTASLSLTDEWSVRALSVCLAKQAPSAVKGQSNDPHKNVGFSYFINIEKCHK